MLCEIGSRLRLFVAQIDYVAKMILMACIIQNMNVIDYDLEFDLQ